MKKLILGLCLLISTHNFANTLPESEIVKAINLQPNAGAKTCKDLPEEPCYSYNGIQWEYAELVDNEVVDYVAQKQYESCNDEADCDDKFLRIVCSEGIKIKNYETLSVYCAVNIMKIEGKKLIESQGKKAAYKAAKKAEKDAEESAKEVKKALKLSIKEDVKTANTVAKLKALIEKLIEAQDEK